MIYESGLLLNSKSVALVSPGMESFPWGFNGKDQGDCSCSLSRSIPRFLDSTPAELVMNIVPKSDNDVSVPRIVENGTSYFVVLTSSTMNHAS